MSDWETTDPYSSFVGMQRRALEQGQRLTHQRIEVQRRSMQMLVDGMDTQRSFQRKSSDVTRTAVEAYLDMVEASVPGNRPTFVNLHAFVRGQFEATDELTNRTWDALQETMTEGTTTYEELSDEYLATLDDSVDAYLDALDEFDGRRGERATSLWEDD